MKGGGVTGQAREGTGPSGEEGERTGPSAELTCGEKGKEGVGRLWLGFWAGLVFFFSGFSSHFLFQTTLN